MEGAGSRHSRAASRYASSPSAPLFSGPVRKWKKQWVSHSTKRNNTPPLLLCRWTPLSAADDAPKRRFRYAPIVPIEKGNKKSGEVEGGASLRNEGEGMVEKPSPVEENQEVSEDQAESSRSQGAWSEDRK